MKMKSGDISFYERRKRAISMISRMVNDGDSTDKITLAVLFNFGLGRKFVEESVAMLEESGKKLPIETEEEKLAKAEAEKVLNETVVEDENKIQKRTNKRRISSKDKPND